MFDDELNLERMWLSFLFLPLASISANSCPDGAVASSHNICYTYSGSQALTFDDAQNACLQSGMRLATMDDEKSFYGFLEMADRCEDLFSM